MTTYEKAKAYDEAIERAKGMHEEGMMPERIEYIFPELKESEDEKIRKGILAWLRETRYVPNDQVEILEQWISWLEKQKPAWSEEDEKMRNWLVDELQRAGHPQRYYDAVKWLKSLKPRWKPTKEQMLAPKRAIGVCGTNGKQLESLYKHLELERKMK